MEKLIIDNINIYKSFKQSSYTIETAIAEFVDNSIKSFNNDHLNKTIIIYWNLNEKWLQIIDNGSGIAKEKIQSLLRVFNSNESNGIGLKAASFYLGDKLTIESKNEELNIAFKTQLDINNESDYAPLIYVKPNELLRSFKSATRITINNLNKTINNDQISHLFFNLSKLFKNYVDDINILIALIKDNTINDISNGYLTPVSSLNEIRKLNFSLPEINESLTTEINETITYNKKQINIRAKAYKTLVDNNLSGIMISNENRTIIGSNSLFKPDWFNENFKSVFIDLKLSGLQTNITKNWFNWNQDLQDEIMNLIYDRVKHLEIKNVKKTKPLVDIENTRKLFVSDETETEHLETSKLYLTKALMNDANNYGVDFEIVKDKLQFCYNCDDGKKIKIQLTRKKDKNSTDWLQLIPISQNEVEQNYEYEVVYNIAHPFFKPFDNDKFFSHRMEHFVVSYAIAETISRLDGLSVTNLKYEISKLLKGMEDDI